MKYNTAATAQVEWTAHTQTDTSSVQLHQHCVTIYKGTSSIRTLIAFRESVHRQHTEIHSSTFKDYNVNILLQEPALFQYRTHLA